jgi:hypothetical protein
MLLVLNNGFVFALHTDDQLAAVSSLYPGMVVYQCPDAPVNPGDPDPRTPAQIAAVYRDQRRVAYAALGDQFDMIYHDLVNGTTVWRDAITAIKTQFPKPTT